MPERAKALLAERRPSLALRSAAGLFFAVAFFWPAISEGTLIDLFAGYAFVDGIATLSAGGWDLAQRPVWPLLIGGCADIAAAAAAYFWPGLTLSGFVDLTAVWAIVLTASFTIAGATLRHADREHLLLLGGIAAGFFGRALLSHTAFDVVVVSTWTGLYALTSGILFLKLTLRLHRPMALDLSTP